MEKGDKMWFDILKDEGLGDLIRGLEELGFRVQRRDGTNSDLPYDNTTILEIHYSDSEKFMEGRNFDGIATIQLFRWGWINVENKTKVFDRIREYMSKRMKDSDDRMPWWDSRIFALKEKLSDSPKVIITFISSDSLFDIQVHTYTKGHFAFTEHGHGNRLKLTVMDLDYVLYIFADVKSFLHEYYKLEE